MTHYPKTLKIGAIDPHPGDLVRTRLLDHLQEGRDKRVTVLTGPDGSGKTTLLSHWPSHAGIAAAWLRLDRFDNDPANFMRGVIQALQKVSPGLGQRFFATLQGSARPSMETMLKQLTDELLLFSQPIGLIIQHYDEIHSQPVHNIVAFLVTHLPPNVQLVLVSKTDPPLNLSGLRTAEMVKEIRKPYLAFSTEETDALLNKVLNLKIAYGDVTAIVERATGDPAAIAAAGHVLSDQKDRPEWVRQYQQSGGDGRAFPFHLLAEALPDTTRNTVQTLASLRVFPGIIADSIRFKNRDNRPIVEIAEQGFWIRSLQTANDLYHIPAPIVTYFGTNPEERLAEYTCRLAVDYYREQEDYPSAINYAIAGGAFQQAAEMIEAITLDYLSRGGLVTVRNWLSQIDPAVLESRPMLTVCKAWVLVLSGEIATLPEVLTAAEAVRNNHENPAEVLEHILAIKQYIEEQPDQNVQ